MKGNEVTKSARPTVAVIGGGYGGVNVAKALDEVADVTLVEPKDAFFHNVAALRGLVDPTVLPTIFIPYDRLLARGRILHDRATQIDGSRVVLGSGDVLAPDFVVLASGSAYPFPAKAGADRADDSQDRVRSTHKALAEAHHALLLGGGPVGVELAGEIRAAWPGKAVTIVDMASDILGDRFSNELRSELRRQLVEIGVELVLGSALREGEPQTIPGELASFTVTTLSGRVITADIWFRCFGVTPVSDYLAGPLARARTAEGFIEVDRHLRVHGFENVFALGDVSTADAKMAGFAGMQSAVVASNLTALSAGSGELQTYESLGPVIAVTIGPEGGAGQLPGQDGVAGPEVVARAKGRTMMVDRYSDILGASRQS
jgi:NADH dehydrogenase FAD-containing subunit